MENEVKITDLSNESSLNTALKIIEILNTHKAHGVKLLHVEDKTIIADYFVFCTGNSNTQVKSLAGEIEYKMGLCNLPPLHMDGYGEGEWVVLDFASVMVHIFLPSARDFYKLDKLWADAEEVDITPYFTE